MATATLAPLYYGIRLSENIARTPEGYLICRNSVIARTGPQEYRGRELSKDDIDRLGLKIAPDEKVTVYRSADEVFKDSAIASFEGKPVCDDHPGGDTFVGPDNYARLAKGHIQNVHMGEEPLESGEFPLVGDILITDPRLADQVEKERLRELSGGYNYRLEVRNGRLEQTDILGNHVAVVPKGRAGSEARIKDAVPDKEKKPVKHTLKSILAAGLKAISGDADPETLTDASLVAARALDSASETGTHTETAAGGKTTDADAMKAKDAEIESLKAENKKLNDAAADKKGKDKGKGKDESEAERKKELEGEDSPEHKESCEDPDCEGECMDKKGKDGEGEGEKKDEGDKGKGSAKDSAIIEPVGNFEASTNAAPRSEAEMLARLRPFVARSKDNALRKAFDTEAGRVRQATKGKGSEGDYGGAARAAGERSARAADSNSPDAENDRCKALNADQKRRHRVNPNEVKQ